MCNETRAMESIVLEDGNEYEIVYLSFFADPDSLKATFNGKDFDPIKADYRGNPIFSYAQLEEVRKAASQCGLAEDNFLAVSVSYDIETYVKSIIEIDTLAGIKQNLKSYESLTQLLINKMKYDLTFHYYDLSSYVIFGRYSLTADGK